MKEDVRGASAVVAIIAMIIGGLVGFAFGINDDGSTTTLITEGKTQIDSPAPKLQQDITLSFSEYYSHVFQLLTETYESGDNPKSAILTAEIDDISEEHARLIARALSIDEETYLSELRDMNALYVDYVNETTDDDGNTSDVRESVNTNIDNQITLLTESAINISAQDLRNELRKINQLQLSFVDEYDATNYEVAFARQREAYEEIKALSNRLTRAAVAQFPEKYTIDKEDNIKE